MFRPCTPLVLNWIFFYAPLNLSHGQTVKGMSFELRIRYFGWVLVGRAFRRPLSVWIRTEVFPCRQRTSSPLSRSPPSPSRPRRLARPSSAKGWGVSAATRGSRTVSEATGLAGVPGSLVL